MLEDEPTRESVTVWPSEVINVSLLRFEHAE